MIAYTKSLLAEADAAAVIFDLSNLEYIWGDAIGGLGLELLKRHVLPPSAIVANGRTASALEPLLGKNFVFGLIGTQMFGTIHEAITYLSEAIVHMPEAIVHVPDQEPIDSLPEDNDPTYWRKSFEIIAFSSPFVPGPSHGRDLRPVKDLTLSWLGETLQEAIVERYGQERVRFSYPPNPVVTFTSAHPEVGALELMDDCDEVTLCIGKIHSHFDSVEELLEFLDNLFNDQVLIWESNDGRRGGWRLLESEDIQVMPNARNYLWSGPISSSDSS